VRSRATGKEIAGVLLTLGCTPREMLRRPPSFTYERLRRAARQAEQMGARLMGLGAFTSVVGDAGITVARQSPIGITTGNALTVAVALETCRRALWAMGRELGAGRVVIIGATGSIGAACARILARTPAEVVLVAPRHERLLALQRLIVHETPAARVHIQTSSEAVLEAADLVIMATSAVNSGLLDMRRVAPGAVVCDIAQPASVCEHEARLRPDVLVVESGDVRLPGAPDIGFNIGLPRGFAYACLAETMLLALEERYSHYTLGRAIEPGRIDEIYRLMQHHGMELAGLRSFGRLLSSDDIARRRALAGQRGEGMAAAQGACTAVYEKNSYSPSAANVPSR
jgi:predicted amino acid dehydrogenase